MNIISLYILGWGETGGGGEEAWMNVKNLQNETPMIWVRFFSHKLLSVFYFLSYQVVWTTQCFFSFVFIFSWRLHRCVLYAIMACVYVLLWGGGTLLCGSLRLPALHIPIDDFMLVRLNLYLSFPRYSNFTECLLLLRPGY